MPSCAKLSVKAIGRLLGVGTLYLDYAHETSCDFYGWPKRMADNPLSVPSGEIRYVSSLQISVIRAERLEFYADRYLLDQGGDGQKLSYGGVDPRLHLGTMARVYHGVITDTDQPACSPLILEDNWIGPPACKPQPRLQKVSVLAYTGPSRGPSVGWLVTVSAAAQYPSRLTPDHVAQLAKDSLAGHIS